MSVRGLLKDLCDHFPLPGDIGCLWKVSCLGMMKVVRTVVVLLAVGVAAGPAVWIVGVVVGVVLATRQINQRIAVLSDPTVYGPAGRELARLCQSDPVLFKDASVFRPAWTPGVILQHEPNWVSIEPELAHVEFGGGFHHYGYELIRSSGNDEGTNHWSLVLYNEMADDVPLDRFDLDAHGHVTKQVFIDNALAEFERRMARNPSNVAAERIAFLLRLDRADLAREAIESSRTRYPGDWLDALLSYVLAAPEDAAALSELEDWAGREDSFSSWLYAAYACEAVGEYREMERFIQRALAAGPPWDSMAMNGLSAPYRGLAMATYLRNAGMYETCERLCDAMLSYEGLTEDAKAGLLSVRAGRLETINADDLFDPFDKVDLKKLRGE